MLSVLALSGNPVGARIGALLAGVSLAVPCFVEEAPLFRGLLMCLMCAPFAAGVALAVVPPITGVRGRLKYLFSWCGTHEVRRRARGLDGRSFVQLLMATVVFAAMVNALLAIPHPDNWLPARWLAGGLMILAFAEMATASFPLVATALGVTVPPLMQSPYRSTSVAEFWSRRWNVFAAEMVFRPCCFTPLARRSLRLGLFATFALSGIGHTLLAFMALGRWKISVICGAFFFVQPLFIATERQLKVRRWRLAARHAWALGALTFTAPLFVEPFLQVVEGSWGNPDNALLPTIGVLGFVIAFSAFVSLASLVAVSDGTAAQAIGSSKRPLCQSSSRSPR